MFPSSLSLLAYPASCLTQLLFKPQRRLPHLRQLGVQRCSKRPGGVPGPQVGFPATSSRLGPRGPCLAPSITACGSSGEQQSDQVSCQTRDWSGVSPEARRSQFEQQTCVPVSESLNRPIARDTTKQHTQNMSRLSRPGSAVPKTSQHSLKASIPHFPSIHQHACRNSIPSNCQYPHPKLWLTKDR